MHDYWIEFSKVALAHLLAVASPGPDFAIVLKQSLDHGKRTALWTSVGIGTAILLHVSYSLFGLGVLLRSSVWWFNAVKIAGAAYFAWLGIQSLRSRPRPVADAAHVPAIRAPADRSAFATGFFTNALNPKVSLFLISLFALIVSPQTPKLIQIGYGVWLCLATIAWFSLVSIVFAQDSVRSRFLRYGHWIDRVLGVVFLVLAAGLLFAKLS